MAACSLERSTIPNQVQNQICEWQLQQLGILVGNYHDEGFLHYIMEITWNDSVNSLDIIWRNSQTHNVKGSHWLFVTTEYTTWKVVETYKLHLGQAPSSLLIYVWLLYDLCSCALYHEYLNKQLQIKFNMTYTGRNSGYSLEICSMHRRPSPIQLQGFSSRIGLKLGKVAVLAP